MTATCYGLDVGWQRHPRFVGRSAVGLLCWSLGIGYCIEYSVDGVLPADPKQLAAALGVKSGEARRAIRDLTEPNHAGEAAPWVVHGDLIYIDGYLAPPGAEDITDNSAARDRGIWGNHKRWHLDRGVKDPDCPHCVPDGSPPDIASDSLPDSPSDSHQRSLATRPSDWLPDSLSSSDDDELRTSSSSSSESLSDSPQRIAATDSLATPWATRPGDTSSDSPHRALPDSPPDDSDPPVPEETWDLYAQLMLDRQPAGSIKNPRPWKLKTAANARQELGDQAQRWWTQFDITPRHLAQCLADGTPPRNIHRRPRGDPP